METTELGAMLRHRRAAAGRTIASVAADAGLSVPYIANLENGRGNPTLAAIASLATALGAHLEVRLTDRIAGAPEPPLPNSLLQFSRTARFRSELARLATTTHSPEAALRSHLLTAMAAMAALTPNPLTDLDYHRILDTAVLITRNQ